MKNLPSVRGTPVRSTKVTEADGHRKDVMPPRVVPKQDSSANESAEAAQARRQKHGGKD